MRKVIACFLTIALVLFAFTACDNKTPTPGTGSNTGGSVSEPTLPDPGTITAPKATIDQLSDFQHLYRYSFLQKNVAITGVVLNGDVYTFTKVEVKNEFNEKIGVLNGTFKDTPEEISMDISFTDIGGKTSTVSGTIKREGKDTVISVNGDNCLIHRYQIPPYRDLAQPIPNKPELSSVVFNSYIAPQMHNAMSTKPEGFTDLGDDAYLYENIKCLDTDGKVIGNLNGIFSLSSDNLYSNITYEDINGETYTFITFWEEIGKDTYVSTINGENCQFNR